MKICIVSLYALPLFAQDYPGVFGGSEVRAWNFAQGLSRFHKQDVSLVVLDHGQPSLLRQGDFDIFSHAMYPAHAANTFYKYRNSVDDARFSRRLKRSIRALKRNAETYLQAGTIESYPVPRAGIRVYDRIKPDVLCVMGVSAVSAHCVFWGKQNGVPIALLLGSDRDVSTELTRKTVGDHNYEKAASMQRYSLNYASHIVAQSESQYAVLRDVWARDATVLSNPIDVTARAGDLQTQRVGEQPYAVWVGKSNWNKQPHLFIELARLFPQYRFKMVMNFSDPVVHQQCVDAAPTNLEIFESMPLDACEQLIGDARVLLSTSIYEGFPNTFLQAGKRSVPVVSLTVNPDGILSSSAGGVDCQGDYDELVSRFGSLMSDDDAATTMGKNLNEYVLMHHDLKRQSEKLNDLLMSMKEGRASES